MTPEDAAAFLSAAIRGYLAAAGMYLGAVVEQNSALSIAQILQRADVKASVAQAFEEAENYALQVVEQAWEESGARTSPVLRHLLHDVRQSYSVRGELRSLLEDMPVREAFERIGRQAALRNVMTLEHAIRAGYTQRVLDQASMMDVLKDTRKQWLAHVERPTCCYWCRNLHGQAIPLHADFSPFIGAAADLTGHGRLTQPPKPYEGLLPGPPLHPHCLPGEILVSAEGARGATARVYHGELVVIRTLSGKLLRCTPNHPVLTPQGWVPAGLLQEGSHVLSARGEEWKYFGDHHDQDVPPAIQQVAEAFLRSRDVASAEVPVTAEDFHGDGAGSEVCVVGADRRLLTESHLTLAQHPSEHFFERAYLGVPLVAQGYQAAVFPALARSPHSIMRGSGDSLSLFRGSVAHAQQVGFLPPTRADAGFEQPLAYGSPVYAQAPGDGLLRLPFFVAPDQVVSVQRDVVTTHVYNLQTNGGWYFGNGVVVHNCECGLLIIPAGSHGLVASEEARRAVAVSFKSSSDIRDMPAVKYRLLIEYLQAAVHELGLVLQKLGSS